MRTPSGDLHVVDFKTNQIVSDIQPKDYWDDKRHWEIKNNIDTLEFRLFENTDYATTLVQQNLVLKEVRGGRIVPYVITETEKDSKDRSLMVYASGEWIQLAKAGIIEPQKIESKTLKQCMEIALKGTKWTIGKTEHDGAHSMVIEEFTDPLDLLKKIAASFELEIQYRAEVVGSKIVGRYVDMVRKRGRDTRKEVTFGKDLIGIKRIENSQSICTALLGFVKKENGEFITISSINKGVPYLVDDAAYQRWNENGKHKFAFYTPQTDDQNMSPDRLLTLMKTEMSKIVNASVSYGVDAQNIARITGLSHEEINEGDTIRIIDEGFTPKLYLEARAIAGDESFKDPTQDNYVFGDYREIVDQNDELRRLYQKILSSLYDKVPQELFDQLNNKVKEQNKDIIDAKDKAGQAQKESQTAKDLAEATQDYMERNLVDIIESVKPPTANLKDGKTLWSDSSDPNNKVLKLWKGGAWVIISPDTKPLNTALTQAQNDITKAKQDITTNKGLLDTAKSELQGNINAEKQRITDLTTNVNKKVDKTWIDQQLLDKADKSGVYTKDYIDQNTIGKQVYETDKVGNVQKFTDMNTDITRNANAIKSKAEQSSLDTTNNNVTGVTNRVTTVEQTATGLTTRIGSAESKINTATGDISTLQTKTNTIEQTATGSVQKINELTGRFDGMSIGSVNIIQGTEEIFSNPSATGNYNGFKSTPPPFPKYNIRGKELTISMYLTGKITAKGNNPWLGMEISVQFVDGTATQYLNGRIDNKIELNKDYVSQRFINTVKVNDKEIKAINVTMGARDLTGSIRLHNGQIEEGNQATAWKLSPEELTTTQQFTQKTNEIINTVDQNAQKLTAVETTMKNTKYGRDNLITNSGMFSNTGGWMANTPANSTMEVVTEDGFNAMKIKGSIRASSPVILKPDTEYVYSALIKIPVDNVISDGSGNPLHFWSTIGENPHTAVQRAILEPASKKILANTWTRVSYKFKTLAGAENTLFTPFMYSQEIINSNAFAYVRYFQLVEGNQITEDWQAPSGDIVKKTNEIVQTIDSTISRVTAVENRRTGSDNLLKVDSARWVVHPKNTGTDADNFNYANLPVNMQLNRTYTVSARVKFTAGTDTHISVYPYPNGSQQHIEIKDGFITHTFKKTNASTVGILLYAGKSATTRSKGVEFTEIMVTEGDGVVAYAPPSPTLDVFTSKTNEITQTVDANKQKISSIESTVSAINDDVTNLFMDAGSFKGYSTTYDPLKRWLLKGAGARISADTFQDNAVAETQSSWSSLCYNFKDLADRGVVKVGDILNVSIYMRIKGLPAGQTKVVSYFFRGRNNAKSFNVSNTWARYDVETTVTADMLTVSGAAPESYMRFEVNENTGGTAWFQQSQPQLTIGTKLYTWRTAPEDISALVVKTNEIIQTVDTNMLTITKAVQGGGENFLYKSSGEKGEIAVLHDDSAYTFNGCTRNATNMDHIQFTCSSYSDAFYQIGATNVNLMHGFSAGETLTLSFDQKQDLTGMQTIIFQHDGTSWIEAEAKTYAQLSWSRESHTFTLKPNTKGWFIRFRFPRVAEANTKNIWLAKLKLEAGSIKSPWSPNSIETMRTQNTLKQDVDSLSSNITSVSNRTGSLETKSNNLQQSLDGTISKVNTLTTTQTNQGTQITQQGSQITQLSNQIDLRVKTTEMQDYVGALGNNNIIMNSAFEDRVIHPTSGIVTNRTPSTTKWTLQGVGTNKTVAADSSVTHEGYNSVKMSSSGYTGSQFVGVSQTLPVTAGSGDYVFSAWFYVTNKALLETEGGVIKLQFFNGSTGSTSLQTELLPKLVNNTWVRLSAKITAPATPVTALRADIWIRRNGVLYAAQPLLQQGSTPSTFMENTKDYANYDQLVGEVAKKVATTEFNSKVSTLETSINQQSNRIDLKAEKTDVYTKKEANGQFGSKAIVDSHTSSIALMAGEITQRVRNNEVASTINQTAQSVLIQANKINLDGAVTAKSIESGRLAGVTISTSANSIGYFIDMNQQNISLKSNVGNTGPITRGYLGFMPNLPDNTVRTALVLGNNYDNANRLEVNGSLFLEQQTPKWNNYDLSNCRIGMARSRNSDGSINMKSSIKMGYMGSIEMRSEDSDIDLDAKGHIRMNTTRGGKSLNDIQLVSGTSMSLDAYNGSWFLNSSSSTGADEWRIRTLHINDKRSGGNTQADVDFRMGHLVTLRIPQHPDYTKYGMEVKNGTGTSLSNIHVDKVYLTQNMWESTRQVKTAIKEIKVDALETLMHLQPKQYYRKSEMQKLYEKREKIVAGEYQEPMPTIKDVPLEYGFIAEEMPECLATEDRKTVSTYPLMTIGIAGTQEVYKKHLALEEIVKEQANQLAIQEDRIARLEELLLQQLIDKKPEQP
ncbi:phage tail spike protein [Bacillus mycoides]|uniref:phage tail spike protein n=1 Tax=Bacillus mycoides TaxID=1405 RepID=UPI0009946FFF|nr:phage tail spike protein [Bacillus mycoides]